MTQGPSPALTAIFGPLGVSPERVTSQRHADLRIDAVGRRARAAQAQFLLHAEDKGHFVFAFAQFLHDLQGDGAADAVVHGGGGDHAVGQFKGVRGVDGHVAEGDHAEGVLAVLGTDVDEEVGHFVVVGGEALGLVGDDAVDAVCEDDVAVQGGALADAAGVVYAQKTMLVGVQHHEADVVPCARRP